MNDGPEWFAPKRFGYGSGLPIAWQGWAVLLAYLALVIGSVFLFEKRPFLVPLVVLPATAMLLILTARTTRGGWRWRWGDPD